VRTFTLCVQGEAVSETSAADQDSEDRKDRKDMSESKREEEGKEVVDVEIEEVKLDDESVRQHKQTQAAVTKLYKLLIHFRNYVSSEKPKLLAKHVNDPKRMEELHTVFLSATTVSERTQVLDVHANPKRWACVGTLRLPSLETCAVGMPLFVDLFTKRLRTPFASPETPLLDHLLVALFQQSTIAPVSDADTKTDSLGQTDVIPVFRNKLTKEIDVLAVIRLLPTHLVREQTESKKARPEEVVVSDFTYQAVTAKRILYLLAVAQKQGAQFPAWLAPYLALRELDPMLTKDTDDDNLTVYWMHALLQLAHQGRDDVLIARLRERLLAWTVKFFVLKQLRGAAISAHRIPHEMPTYGPDTVPFVADVPSELAFVVRADEKGRMLNHVTRKPYDDGAKVVTNEKEIARLYERNFECRGALVRPTYLCDGKVTLWSDKLTTVSQAMAEQLQYLSEHLGPASPFASQLQINAHMHTMADLGLYTAVPSDAKDEEVERVIQRIVATGRKARPIMDRLTFLVPAATIVDHVVSVASSPYVAGLVRSVFEIPNPPPKDWVSDIDFMIAHAQQYVKKTVEQDATEMKEVKEERRTEIKTERNEEDKSLAVASPVPKSAQPLLDDILQLYANQFKAAVACALTSPSICPSDQSSSSSSSTGQPLVKSSAGSKTYLLF
jgi:hypothetical protein